MIYIRHTSLKKSQTSLNKMPISLTPAEVLASYQKFGNDMVQIDFATGRPHKTAYVTYFSTFIKHPDTEELVPAYIKINKAKIFGCKSPALRGELGPSYCLTGKSIGAHDSPIGEALTAFNSAWLHQIQVHQNKARTSDKVHAIVQTHRKLNGAQVPLDDSLIRVKLRCKSATENKLRSHIAIVNKDRSIRKTTEQGKEFDTSNIHLDLTSGSLVADNISLTTSVLSREGYSNSVESTQLYINKSDRFEPLSELDIEELLTEY